MTLAESLTAALKAGVASVSSRVYAVVAEQEPTYPFLTYRIRKVFDPDLDMDLEQKAEIEVRSWAESYEEGHITAAQVRTALHGYSGILGGAGGVDASHLICTDEEDDYAMLTESEAAFSIISRFDILYS